MPAHINLFVLIEETYPRFLIRIAGQFEMRSEHHVFRSTGSVAAGWSIGSHSSNRDFDTWRRLYSVERFRILTWIIDRKAVIVACAFVGQASFVQNVVDPHPSSKGELASKAADTTCAELPSEARLTTWANALGCTDRI